MKQAIEIFEELNRDELENEEVFTINQSHVYDAINNLSDNQKEKLFENHDFDEISVGIGESLFDEATGICRTYVDNLIEDESEPRVFVYERVMNEFKEATKDNFNFNDDELEMIKDKVKDHVLLDSWTSNIEVVPYDNNDVCIECNDCNTTIVTASDEFSERVVYPVTIYDIDLVLENIDEDDLELLKETYGSNLYNVIADNMTLDVEEQVRSTVSWLVEQNKDGNN